MEQEIDDDTNCNWSARYSHKRISIGTGRLGSKRTCGNHPGCSIIDIDQNTEKRPGDMRILAVTQSPVRHHQLTLV